MCRHVQDGQLPVLQVVRHHDGFWDFTCGTEEHPEIDAFVGLCGDCNMRHLKEYQMLQDLKPGEWARRESGDSREWEILLLPPEEETEA